MFLNSQIDIIRKVLIDLLNHNIITRKEYLKIIKRIDKLDSRKKE